MSRGSLLAYLAIAITLLLVTIVAGEIYYLFFYQPKPKTIQPREISLPTTTPSPATPRSQSSQLDFYERRLYATNSAIVSFTTTQKFEGKIIELDTKGGVDKSLGNFSYALKFVIKGKGDLPNQFYLTSSNLPQLTIVQKTSLQETPIEIIDLKIGDEITFDRTIDITKNPTPDNLVSAKITKLQK